MSDAIRVARAECDVAGKLAAVLSEQIRRLTESSIMSAEDSLRAFAELREKKLTPEAVEQTLWLELKTICSVKHQKIADSKRRGGYGFTLDHIKEHMRALLKRELDRTAAVLRTHSRSA